MSCHRSYTTERPSTATRHEVVILHLQSLSGIYFKAEKMRCSSSFEKWPTSRTTDALISKGNLMRQMKDTRQRPQKLVYTCSLSSVTPVSISRVLVNTELFENTCFQIALNHETSGTIAFKQTTTPQSRARCGSDNNLSLFCSCDALCQNQQLTCNRTCEQESNEYVAMTHLKLTEMMNFL